MVERHYDDEALISLMETGRVASDAHLPSCKACSEKLQSFRDLSDVLHDGAVWDRRPLSEEPVRSTIETLRAFADRMTDEDTRAEVYLKDLLAAPREEWMPRLQQHPEYRTAGMVRKLIAASEGAIDTMPPDAVEITRLATEIADHLDPTSQPSDTVARLRGAAWRDRAYVLLISGKMADAADAARRSQTAFETCKVADYDIARLGLVQTTIERHLDDRSAAIGHARRSAVTFQTFGDESRVISGGLAEAGVLAQSGRYADALAIWESLERRFAPDTMTHNRATLLMNIGFAQRHLGRLDKAIDSFTLAADGFECLGSVTEAARVKWNLASAIIASGRLEEGADYLLRVRSRFLKLGMLTDAAETALELAETRLIQGRVADVPELCATAMEEFTTAGLSMTPRALTAVAYAREAAQAGRATPQLLRHVRDYVRRLPEEPALLFAPPPFPSD